MTSESGRDGQLGSPADHTLVDAIPLVHLVETIGDKHNKVSLEHQAWRPMITTPLIEGGTQFSFLAGWSVFASKGGSLLASAEDAIVVCFQSTPNFPSWTSRVRSPSPALQNQQFSTHVPPNTPLRMGYTRQQFSHLVHPISYLAHRMPAGSAGIRHIAVYIT